MNNLKCDVCDKTSVTTRRMTVLTQYGDTIEIYVCGFCERFIIDPKSIINEVKEDTNDK